MATPNMPADLQKDLWNARAAGPDIVALGLQEMVPLSAGNVVVGEWGCGVQWWLGVVVIEWRLYDSPQVVVNEWGC